MELLELLQACAKGERVHINLMFKLFVIFNIGHIKPLLAKYCGGQQLRILSVSSDGDGSFSVLCLRICTECT